ncbi:MAG: L-threonylcarbamoyladenylate synthase [Armatimonadetes bacterium]|nr:L-threonylcarbamoyladenylate synthase [Armatimonadota bacterium]
MTEIIRIHSSNRDWEIIQRAADALAHDQLVVFPTETVYGLAGDLYSEKAAQAVYRIKGRDPGKPLPVQVAGLDDLKALALNLTDETMALVERFMPGPITLILNRSPHVPNWINPSGSTVGIRWPDHPIALSLLQKFGRPIFAPSANRSGQPPPITAQEAMAGLGDEPEIGLTLDSGPAGGLASTVVDLTCSPVRILRHGPITREQIERLMPVALD